MKKIFIFLLFICNLNTSALSKNNLYDKIDIFGEVLESIKKDYVDEVNQAEIMDAAINGVLQSLDPYSAYMSPELFNEMQTDTRGEFGGLGIENCRIEGRDSNDWKLVDAHDVIVHIFHPEKREFYDLEKMWSEEIPKERATL